MKTTWMIGAAAAVLFLGTSESEAQVGGIRSPVRQPTVTPYLNLLRNDFDRGGLGFNYYQRLLPQQDYLQTSQRLTSQLNRVSRRQSQIQREIESGLGVTGHQTTFMDYRGYFPQRGR